MPTGVAAMVPTPCVYKKRRRVRGRAPARTQPVQVSAPCDRRSTGTGTHRARGRADGQQAATVHGLTPVDWRNVAELAV